MSAPPPAPPGALAPPPPPDDDDALYASDEFRMYCFKVGGGERAGNPRARIFLRRWRSSGSLAAAKNPGRHPPIPAARGRPAGVRLHGTGGWAGWRLEEGERDASSKHKKAPTPQQAKSGVARTIRFSPQKNYHPKHFPTTPPSSGLALRQALLPRLDDVSLRAPGRKGGAPRPAREREIHRHRVPGHEGGRRVRARGRVPVRAQRV